MITVTEVNNETKNEIVMLNGEAALVTTLLRAQRQYEASRVRLAFAEQKQYEYGIENERENVAECKAAVEMWTEDLALLRGGMSLEDLEMTAEARDEAACMAA
jgi:hypothetical protein